MQCFYLDVENKIHKYILKCLRSRRGFLFMGAHSQNIRGPTVITNLGVHSFDFSGGPQSKGVVGHSRGGPPSSSLLDVDAERIPEKIFEQVCRGCPSCGPHRTCTQLTLPYEVNYRKTINETSRLVIRSGCICLPLGVGSRAFSFDI